MTTGSATIASLAVGTGVAVALTWLIDAGVRRRTSRAARTQIGLEREVTPRELPRVSTPMVAAVISTALIAVALVGPVGILLGALPPIVWRVVTSRRRRARRTALDAALGGVLQLLIDQLRVGRDLTGAMQAIVDRADAPLDELLENVLAAVRLGAPIHEVLEEMASAESSRHLDVIASAIGLHAHHGGSLTEILTTVAESIDAEDNLRREVETLTADARLSAQVLLGLPVAALALLSLLSPGYATPLFSTSAGQTMCIIAGILGSAGWWWLRTLSRVGDAL
ncbi:type II secretion system F family protein [uncultured Ilumatobacter sp.]|uniref:type II secretion system F family protein n=1 Tax=uncultured Ilumatobacter sp. TaxID=879968 RepID=UPI00374F50C5